LLNVGKSCHKSNFSFQIEDFEFTHNKQTKQQTTTVRMNKVIVGLFAILVLVAFTFAEDFGTTYTVIPPVDSFSYNLEGGETLAVTITTADTFEVTVTNSTTDLPSPPAGYEALYSFAVEESSSVDQVVVFSYNYDVVTKELYDVEKTKVGTVVNGAWVYLPVTVDTAAMQVNGTVSGVPAAKTFDVAIFVTTKGEESVMPSESPEVSQSGAASSEAPVVNSSNKPVESSHHVLDSSNASAVSLTYFSAVVALIVTVLCL
jgi:hypothetical protein